MPELAARLEPAAPPWRDSLRLAGPLALVKIAILFLVYASLRLIPIPFNVPNYVYDRHANVEEPISVSSAYRTWDAQFYLHISQDGYVRVDSRRFFPLWPGVIHVASFFGDPLVASLVVGNLLSLAALVLLHRWATLKVDPPAADATLLLMLCFPSAFFLCLPYSESLFLLLAVSLFIGIQMRRPALIWTMSFLAVLARPVGWMVVFPILADSLLKRQPRRALALATGPAAGCFAYLAIFQMTTGDPLAGLRVTMHTNASLSQLLHPIDFLHTFFFAPGIEMHGIASSIIDRVVFVLVLIALGPMIRRFPVEASYCLLCALIPAMTQPMISFTRLALVLFPVFLVGGIFLSRPGRRWWLYVLGVLGESLQVIFLVRHVHAFWVA